MLTLELRLCLMKAPLDNDSRQVCRSAMTNSMFPKAQALRKHTQWRTALASVLMLAPKPIRYRSAMDHLVCALHPELQQRCERWYRGENTVSFVESVKRSDAIVLEAELVLALTVAYVHQIRGTMPAKWDVFLLDVRSMALLQAIVD